MSGSQLALCGDDEADDRTAAESQSIPRPAESNIKQMMTILYDPAFDRLREAIDVGEGQEIEWERARSELLLFAELAARLRVWHEVISFESEEKREQYQKWLEDLAIEKLEDEALLAYRAARDEDAERTKHHYERMVVRCNDCHAKNRGWTQVTLKPYRVVEKADD